MVAIIHIYIHWTFIYIHVNDFGCQACDQNLTVVNMVIFLSMFKQWLLLAFYNIRRSLTILLKLLFWVYPSERQYRNISSVARIVAVH